MRKLLPILLILMLLIIPVFADDTTIEETYGVKEIETLKDVYIEPTPNEGGLFDFLKPEVIAPIETPIPLADDSTPLIEGEVWKQDSALKIEDAQVTFQSLTNTNIKATTSIKINDVAFAPATTKTDGIELVYGTGEKGGLLNLFDTPTTEIKYSYTGNTLKETITLKEDRELSFPIVVEKGSKLIPWYNGQWKIVADDNSGNTMVGLVLEKPYGIDANKNRVEMEYIYENGELKLKYDRILKIYNDALTKSANERDKAGFLIPKYIDTPIAYPLVIDPTWTAVGDRWEATDGEYTVVMWNATGTTTWSPPIGVTSIHYLVVGGGASGGGQRGGGGGAGGFLSTTTYGGTGTPVTVSAGTSETIVVGTGGASVGSAASNGNPGNPSSIKSGSHSDIEALGGGYGANLVNNGGNGASGGGAGETKTGGTATAGQGNVGGNGGTSSGYYAQGGGGGAGGAGGNGDSLVGAGNGGAGIDSSITGASSGYAGGGGGGYYGGTDKHGTATHGGGAGGVADGTAVSGTAGTGGGGGGASNNAGSGSSGAGGSGVVIIRYKSELNSDRIAFGATSNQSFIKGSTGFNAGTYFYNGTYETPVLTSYVDDMSTNTTYRYVPMKYNEVNGGAVSTPVAGTEVETSNSYNIQENTYNASVLRLKSYKFSGGEFETSFKVSNDGGSVTDFTGFDLTMQDVNNTYQIVVGNSTAGSSNLSIFKVIAGTRTLMNVSGTNSTYQRGNLNWLKVKFDPNQGLIDAWIRPDSQAYSTASNSRGFVSSFPYGSFGMYGSVATAGAGNLAITWDNITIKATSIVGETNIPATESGYYFRDEFGVNSTGRITSSTGVMTGITVSGGTLNQVASTAVMSFRSMMMSSGSVASEPLTIKFEVTDNNAVSGNNHQYIYFNSDGTNNFYYLGVYPSTDGSHPNKATLSKFVAGSNTALVSYTPCTYTQGVKYYAKITVSTSGVINFYWDAVDASTLIFTTTDTSLKSGWVELQTSVTTAANANSSYDNLIISGTRYYMKPMLRGAQIGEYYNGTTTIAATRFSDDFNFDTSGEYTSILTPTFTPTIGYVSINQQYEGIQTKGLTVSDFVLDTQFYKPSNTDDRFCIEWDVASGTDAFQSTGTKMQMRDTGAAITIVRRVSGTVLQTMFTWTYSAANFGSGIHKLSLSRIGANYNLSVDGVVVGTGTDTSPLTSRSNINIGTWSINTELRYYNFNINALESTSPNGISTNLRGVPHGDAYGSNNTASVSGYSPLTVNFTDVSAYYDQISPVLTRNWSFQGIAGDNNTKTVFSTASYALGTFGAGNFSIKLNDQSVTGTLESPQTFWVNVTQPAISSFTANKTGGISPLPVHFTDTSTYSPSMWNWSINNTVWYNYTTSTNLDYTFVPLGIHNVSLTVSQPTLNSFSNTTRMNISVNNTVGADFVGTPLSAYVPQEVSFVDYSIGEGLYSWAWTFGDGGNSALRNPTHTYTTAGSYTVSLTTTGVDGISTKTVPNYVTINTGNIFSANATKAYTYGFPVQFTDSQPSGHLTWNWSFGDGYYNNSQTPTHYYSVAGLYSVSLNVTDSMGYNRTTQTNYINLTSDLPNVKSWLHMDGAAGGTSFPGKVGSAWTPTSVTTETSNKRFGTASAYFNAASSRLQTPSSSMFDFGTGDFTIEGQVYITSSGLNQFIISRTSNANTRADGWGIYHSTNSAASNGWVFWAGAAQTGTFTLPLNTWAHLAIERESGIVTVYVNGIPVITPITAAGNYDTANAVAYGNPLVGGVGSSARMYLDETRISNVARWSPFSPPLAPYAGDLYPTYPDPNPGSTLRFKTDPSPPPSNAIISNITPRYRTIQIQNVNITNNISLVMLYNKNHFFVSSITPNSTTYTGINFTNVVNTPTSGSLLINATRTGGFSTIGQPDNRASIADVRMIYWNYTEPEEDAAWDDDDEDNTQFFGSGYLKNTTTSIDYPVNNFIATNVSVIDWITYSNFTANTTTPVVNEQPVFLTNENNFTSTRVLWDFGDGTTFLSHNQSVEHMYTSIGAKTVTSTAYLWQNNSVTNTTTRLAYINPVYNASWVHADFEAVPTGGSVGVAITFTDLSTWGSSDAVSGRTYNWSFGDGLYSATPYSNVKGSVTHVYPALGTYTVNLTVNNTLSSDYEEKLNYITISSSQSSTALNLLYPKDVTIKVVDINYNPQQGANVSAEMLTATVDTTNWFNTLFGISPVADSPRHAALYGYTDEYGVASFPMLASGLYHITITNATTGINVEKDLQPIQSVYTYVVSTTALSPTKNSGDYITANLTVFDSPPNVYLNMTYIDLLQTTNDVTFYVKFANQTSRNTQWFPAIFGSNQSVNTSYSVANIANDAYVWGYAANNTQFGWLNQSKGITLNGATGILYNPFIYKGTW